MKSLKACLTLGLIISGVTAAPVSAQDEQALRRGLIRCAGLETPDARLICFEALASLVLPHDNDALAPAPLRQNAAPLPDESKQKKQDFGAKRLKQPKQSASKAEKEAARAKPEKKQDGIAYNVTRVSKDGERRYVFQMENGQIWRQIEPSYIRVPKTAPFNVRITQGTFGDYKLRVDGKGRFSRVIRIK